MVRRAVPKNLFTERDGAAEFESLEWLEDGKHPLDWNGPTGRVFTRFPDEDLNRPIIDHFERVTRRHRNRIAVTDSDTSLSFAELWNGLSGLAETIAEETKPGDLIGIVLPTCSMFPVALGESGFQHGPSDHYLEPLTFPTLRLVPITFGSRVCVETV